MQIRKPFRCFRKQQTHFSVCGNSCYAPTGVQIYSQMNVGHGRPRFQNVKLISCGSTSCNFFKYLSLASLDCKLSKYLDKNNSGRLSRRFHCAYFRYHFLLKLSKQLEVVLQLAHSKCGHRRGNGSIESGENNWTHIPASLPTL